MASVEKFLREICIAIEPTVAQKEGAARSHGNLRYQLDQGQFGGRILGSYLSGSYARDTAITPLDDVDIIILIDPKKWTNNDLFIFFRPPPSTILDSFANAIRYRYAQSSVFRQRRSVRLELSHLNIDVVPAIEANNDVIWIPDRDKGDWIGSAPKTHEKNASAVNKRVNGNFKPLVKLLKCWNSRLPSTAYLKSFTIETMAVRLFTHVNINSLEEGMLLFFDFVTKFKGGSQAYIWKSDYGMSFGWFGSSVPDVSSVGSNTAASVDYQRLQRFLQNAEWARDDFLAARNAQTTQSAEKRVAKAFKL